ALFRSATYRARISTSPRGGSGTSRLLKKPATRLRFSAACLFRQMERHAGDDDVGPEQQRALDQQGRLIVIEVLPPALWHEFRQDDGDVIAAFFFGRLLDVFEQRLHQRTVWGGEYDQF